MIPRRYPNAPGPSGVLVNLREIDTLFFRRGEVDIDDGDDDNNNNNNGELDDSVGGERRSSRRGRYCVYPQAGLRDWGHVQSNVLPTEYKPYFDRVNESVGKRRWVPGEFRAYDSDDEAIVGDQHGDDDGTWRVDLPILVAAVQVYNLLMHRTRSTRREHDAQLAQVTGACAGGYAMTDREKKAHTTVLTDLGRGLPHERFEQKIDGLNPPRSLRQEVVFHVDMDKLDELCFDGE